MSFCEFRLSLPCAEFSSQITVTSIPLTRALLLASPSLVGQHALTWVCLIQPPSPLNHRRLSSCSPKTIICSSRIAPRLRFGRHEATCPSHFPRHCTHGSSSRWVWVSSMYTTMNRLSLVIHLTLGALCNIYLYLIPHHPSHVSRLIALDFPPLLVPPSKRHLHGPHSAFRTRPLTNTHSCDPLFTPR